MDFSQRIANMFRRRPIPRTETPIVPTKTLGNDIIIENERARSSQPQNAANNKTDASHTKIDVAQNALFAKETLNKALHIDTIIRTLSNGNGAIPNQEPTRQALPNDTIHRTLFNGNADIPKGSSSPRVSGSSDPPVVQQHPVVKHTPEVPRQSEPTPRQQVGMVPAGDQTNVSVVQTTTVERKETQHQSDNVLNDAFHTLYTTSLVDEYLMNMNIFEGGTVPKAPSNEIQDNPFRSTANATQRSTEIIPSNLLRTDKIDELRQNTNSAATTAKPTTAVRSNQQPPAVPVNGTQSKAKNPNSNPFRSVDKENIPIGKVKKKVKVAKVPDPPRPAVVGALKYVEDFKQHSGAKLAIAVEPLIKQGMCLFCGQSTVEVCAKCGRFYCSTICQKIDWPIHFKICTEMPTLVASNTFHQTASNPAAQLPAVNRAEQQQQSSIARPGTSNGAKILNPFRTQKEIAATPNGTYNASLALVTSSSSIGQRPNVDHQHATNNPEAIPEARVCEFPFCEACVLPSV